MPVYHAIGLVACSFLNEIKARRRALTPLLDACVPHCVGWLCMRCARFARCCTPWGGFAHGAAGKPAGAAPKGAAVEVCRSGDPPWKGAAGDISYATRLLLVLAHALLWGVAADKVAHHRG